MRLEIHPDAEAELLEAADWYDSRRARLGDELLEEVDQWLEVILEAPVVWPAWPGSMGIEPHIRPCLLSRFRRYAIAYQLFPDRVPVIAFPHTSRRPFYWLERAGK